MKPTTTVEITPDEQLLQDALRDGWAVKKDISMNLLGEPDTKLQARVVHLNEGHVARLREVLQESGRLRSIVVFRESSSRKLWLADGFHRHEAYRLEGKTMIPAFVLEGGYRSALKFATMCNRGNCLGRTREDERKAAFMLFSDPEWSNKSNGLIGENIGKSSKTIDKWRLEFCRENKVEVPSIVETKKGYTLKRSTDQLEGSKKKVSELRRRGLLVIGDVDRYIPNGHAIVICRDRPSCSALDVAKLIGAEFMTPEELVENLKEFM